MDAIQTEGIFADFLVLSQRAFDNGLYESAYHALQAAFHCALTLGDTQRLLMTERVAKEQIASIDRCTPESIMSTFSARDRRGGVSFYQVLIKQSAHHAHFIQQKEARDQRLSAQYEP